MNTQWELNIFIEKWIEYCLDKYKGVMAYHAIVGDIFERGNEVQNLLVV
jgi:hypothetical protein